MNAIDLSNQIIDCMAKGHAFSGLEHRQELAAAQTKIAELTKERDDARAELAALKAKATALGAEEGSSR